MRRLIASFVARCCSQARRIYSSELGLLEYILAQPHSILTEGLIRINGKTAGGFSFNTVVPEYPYAIWMPQPIFLQALVEKAGPFSSFQCWMGAKATELIEDGGTITGIRGLRHGEEPFEIPSRCRRGGRRTIIVDAAAGEVRD